MTKERLQYLLDRYLDQTATAEELQEYAAWYQQSAENGEQLFDGDGAAARDYRRQLLADIRSNIRFLEKPSRPPLIRYMKWAAAAAVVAAGIVVLYNITKVNNTNGIAQGDAVQDASAGRQVVIENNTDKSRRIQLQDGSIAELFPNSELSYNEPFGTKDRNLFLKGKGFFEVAQQASKPFTVYSRKVATTALGTAFTVTAWPQQDHVLVALHNGRVVVRYHNIEDVYLQPGQQLSCNVTTGATQLQPIEGAGKTVTIGGRTGFATNFDQAPVNEVLDALQKGYGVTIDYQKEDMEDLLFSGNIRQTDSLSQVLKRMSLLYNLKIKSTDKQYIIRRNH